MIEFVPHWASGDFNVRFGPHYHSRNPPFSLYSFPLSWPKARSSDPSFPSVVDKRASPPLSLSLSLDYANKKLFTQDRNSICFTEGEEEPLLLPTTTGPCENFPNTRGDGCYSAQIHPLQDYLRLTTDRPTHFGLLAFFRPLFRMGVRNSRFTLSSIRM